MRAAATLAPLALLATSCGGKGPDPYAESLAMGSEHVKITADISYHKVHGHLAGSGDFTNSPDRGQYSFVVRGKTHRQVFANRRLYVFVAGRWYSTKMTAHTPQTPAQMFRAHLPARIENGLVRSITIHDVGSTAIYDFSRYGEHVSVKVPRVEGAQ